VTLRIAYARIMQESHALSPVLTTFEDFRSSHFVEGSALGHATSRGGHEVRGFLRNAELTGFVHAVRKHGAEPIPLFSAWTVSGGPLERVCFDELRERLRTSLLGAGRVDGLYLCLHGAMCARGVVDPDSRLIETAREVLGERPIAVSHDLHANLTRERMQLANVLCAYHTNPHRDHAATGFRTGRLLVQMLEKKIRPRMAWRSLPMFLGGGTNLDFWPPLRSLFARMRRIAARPGMLDASVLTVHPFNDHPALGWSTVAIADGDQAKAELYADELADAAWAIREQLPPEFMSASEAIRRARASRLARKLGCILFVDTSDVVTAGAPGENTAIVRALVEEGRDLRSLVVLRDPVAIATLDRIEIGSTVELALGGKLDPAHNEPLVFRGTLRTKKRETGFQRMAVLDVGRTSIVVVEGPALAFQPFVYKTVGLDPLTADVVVVKSYFPPLLYFAPYYRKVYFVKTRGITDWDSVHSLPFDGPMWPRDDVPEWRPRDAKRRGVVPGVGAT
jgi:microcystin degradation protein MlrC